MRHELLTNIFFRCHVKFRQAGASWCGLRCDICVPQNDVSNIKTEILLTKSVVRILLKSSMHWSWTNDLLICNHIRFIGTRLKHSTDMLLSFMNFFKLSTTQLGLELRSLGWHIGCGLGGMNSVSLYTIKLKIIYVKTYIIYQMLLCILDKNISC
jgi:hypothetical protein